MCFNKIVELDDFLQELDEDVEGMQSTILFLQQELKTSKDAVIGLERENMALKNGNTEGNNCSNNNVTSINNVQNGNAAAPMITNCSVVLYSGNSDKIIANSERILRKDKLIGSNNVSAEPRTLRSSTRNVSSDDLRTTMGVSKTKQMQLQCNGGAATTDDIMMVTNGSGDTDDLESTKIYANCNNDKRNYDSDSSSDDECGGGDGDGEANANENNKQLRTKKVRRSSVLSIDLNEEDSQIEIDEERTLNGSGTKSRIVD